MRKNFSKDITPETSDEWKKNSIGNRIRLIYEELKKSCL